MSQVAYSFKIRKLQNKNYETIIYDERNSEVCRLTGYDGNGRRIGYIIRQRAEECGRSYCSKVGKVYSLLQKMAGLQGSFCAGT